MTIGEKRPVKRSSNNLGPGAYNPNMEANKARVPGARIMNSSSSALNLVARNKSQSKVGPGTYDTPIKAMNVKSVLSFSKQIGNKTAVTKGQLGPGSYNVTPVKARAPSVAFSKKPRTSELPKTMTS
jgi:hypothetical protein